MLLLLDQESSESSVKLLISTSAVSLQSGRIGADEVIDDSEGKAVEELEERLNEKEAKTRAILLEMVNRSLRSSYRETKGADV